MSRVSIPDLGEIVGVFRKEYAKTPKLVKVVDCFIVYAVTTALLQYSYMLICGSFPYNAFLAGLGCSLGFAILTGMYSWSDLVFGFCVLI